MKFGPWEIGLILIIILIVFGVGKLPQVGNAIGSGIREFRKAQRGDEEEKKPVTKGEITEKRTQDSTV